MTLEPLMSEARERLITRARREDLITVGYDTMDSPLGPLWIAVGPLGANPIPIVVPCHRVVATDGSLGGYAGGLDAKRRLLALERGEARVPAGGWPPARKV